MFLGPISACGTIFKARGHEIMPHGYKHANKQSLPFAEAKDLILRCLDVFDKELKGFDRKQAIFNFPYNASTPELETVAANPGAGLQDGRGSDQSAAAQGAGEADLHELRARQLRERPSTERSRSCWRRNPAG